MSRVGKVVVSVSFVAFLAHSLVIGPLLYDADEYSQLVNRPLTTVPDLGVDDLLDAGTYEELGDYVGDRYAFRPDWMAAYSSLAMDVFGDNPAPGRVIPAGDWLYHAGHVKRYCSLPAAMATATSRLAILRNAVTSLGKTLTVVLSPSKEVVYDGPLRESEFADPEDVACIEPGAQAVRDFARRFAGTVVTVEDDFVRAAATPGTPEVFHRQDIHPTTFGASLIAKGIVDALQPGLWEPGSLNQAGTETRLGDLSRVMYLPEYRESPLYDVRRPGVRVTVADEWGASDRYGSGVDPDSALGIGKLDEPSSFELTPDRETLEFTVPHLQRARYPLRQFRTSGGPVIEGRTAIVHNSIMWDMMPQVVPYFREVSFVQSRSPEAVTAMREADNIVVQLSYLDVASVLTQQFGALLAVLSEDLRQAPMDERTEGDGSRRLRVTPPSPLADGDRVLLLAAMAIRRQPEDDTGATLRAVDPDSAFVEQAARVPRPSATVFVFDVTNARGEELSLTISDDLRVVEMRAVVVPRGDPSRT